jgi:hypothetical protein
MGARARAPGRRRSQSARWHPLPKKGRRSEVGPGGVPCRARARTATETSDATETDRLLQLYGRDLHDVLTKVSEPGWPRLLRAYDGYARNPTGQTHRVWMAARSAASI